MLFCTCMCNVLLLHRLQSSAHVWLVVWSYDWQKTRIHMMVANSCQSNSCVSRLQLFEKLCLHPGVYWHCFLHIGPKMDPSGPIVWTLPAPKVIKKGDPKVLKIRTSILTSILDPSGSNFCDKVTPRGSTKCGFWPSCVQNCVILGP